jgi:hypothetical protein
MKYFPLPLLPLFTCLAFVALADEPSPSVETPILFLDSRPLAVAAELDRHAKSWHGMLNNPKKWTEREGEQTLLVADLSQVPFRVQSFALRPAIVDLTPFAEGYASGGTHLLGHFLVQGLLKSEQDSGANLVLSMEQAEAQKANAGALEAATRGTTTNWMRLTNRYIAERGVDRSYWQILRPSAPAIRWVHHDGSLLAIHTGHGNKRIDGRQVGVDVYCLVTATGEVTRYIVTAHGH